MPEPRQPTQRTVALGLRRGVMLRGLVGHGAAGAEEHRETTLAAAEPLRREAGRVAAAEGGGLPLLHRPASEEAAERRAEAVKKYMVDGGIDESRLTTRGAGPDEPIADNATKEGQAQNRRTEFKVLKKDD